MHFKFSYSRSNLINVTLTIDKFASININTFNLEVLQQLLLSIPHTDLTKIDSEFHNQLMEFNPTYLNDIAKLLIVVPVSIHNAITKLQGKVVIKDNVEEKYNDKIALTCKLIIQDNVFVLAINQLYAYGLDAYKTKNNKIISITKRRVSDIRKVMHTEKFNCKPAKNSTLQPFINSFCEKTMELLKHNIITYNDEIIKCCTFYIKYPDGIGYGSMPHYYVSFCIVDESLSLEINNITDLQNIIKLILITRKPTKGFQSYGEYLAHI